MAMGMLGNSVRGLHPKERRLLYRSCMVPIATYGFRLWFYNKAPIKGVMKLLTSMQRKAAIWITGAFKTSPTGGYRKGAREHPAALNRLSIRERPKLRGAIADTHSEILVLTETFAPCALEARPGQRLLDLFPACTVFHLRSEYPEPEPGTPPDTADVAAYHVWLYENVVEGTTKAHLDGIRDEAHAEPNTVYGVTDASVPAEKRYQALAGFALFQGDERVDSAHYVSGKVLAPEAELSAIRFAVVRATQVPGCTRIVIFTDHIASAKKALDPSVHSGQGHSLAVCRALLVWFAADPLNTLEFYDCPSKAEWDSRDFGPG
ncbi:hypothetical protein HYPSUDRAFT_199938 [Hypholoma sublateritium FD-334 SS-4]|uniref:Uncharacterized protein n=1 Tax=Hypholoma sublateritium (strain FD-334 SS-4) TaxID=945553 RepID=A0A0D2P9W7_HYPSF|nr:hypothetical protein HYPSUDRAFT_199938 [Hypholoma sublateritium FD-334 SS-4]